MDQIFQEFLLPVRGGILQIYRFVRYVLLSFFELIWLLFDQKPIIPPPPAPKIKKISVTETYNSKIKVSGVKKYEQSLPQGRIEITIPFDKYRHTNVSLLPRDQEDRAHLVRQILYSLDPGFIQIDEYGESNIYKESYLNVLEHRIPLILDTQTTQIPDIELTSEFDNIIVCEYSPELPQKLLVNISVQILDADAKEDEQTVKKIKNTTDAKELDRLLLEHIKKHVDVNPELIIRFQIEILLPESVAQQNSINLNRMTLSWPLNLPHWKAELYDEKDEVKQIKYFPEQGFVEWADIKLVRERQGQTEQEPIQENGSNQEKIYKKYKSGLYILKLKDPSEIYLLSKLTGVISFELDELVSGLKIYHVPQTDLIIEKSTIFETKYTIDLEEFFTQRCYFPKQHLYFPGVVLNNIRLGDVFMLLRDEGFEVPEEGSLQPKQETESDIEKQRYIITAIKKEGIRNLVLWLILEGINSETRRERDVLGDNRYITHLPTGITTIDIWGQLEGDYKRVVNVINEIQLQLKEQFRHVSSAD